MFTVATVLKSGGIYRPAHVKRLQDQLRRFHGDARFLCLTDVPRETPGAIALEQNWRGWWSKIELFRPGLWSEGERVIFLDLDTDIVRPITPLIRNSFTMLSDFYRPQYLASGVMAWTGEPPRQIWNRFNPQTIGKWKGPGRHGDQGYIAHALGGHSGADRFGSEVCSYKKHKIGQGHPIPDAACVIAYHGKPKPWDLANPPITHEPDYPQK